MLSLRHLMIFKAVSETGNFTRAAQKMYITQSAVSHTIRELEEYTGTVLFDRLSKQVRLTSNGKLLLDEVSPILADFESLDKRIGHLELRAPLQIVSSITIASYWLPQILLKAKKIIPDTPIYVKVVTASEAVATLQSGGADIAFVEGIEPQGPFLCRRFADYPLKTVCSPDYPISSGQISIGEFCASSLLLREPGSAIRDILDSQLFLLGRTSRPAWVSVNSAALMEAAKAGLGITVLPEMLVREELARQTLITLEVEGLSLKNELIAVWHKDKYITSALDALISCI